MTSNISHPDASKGFADAASKANALSCGGAEKKKLNVKKYWHHFEGLEITEKEKEEIIKTIWRIMESFADVSFGLHPVQTIDRITQKNASEHSPDSVQSEINSNVKNKDNPAKLEAPGRREA